MIGLLKEGRSMHTGVAIFRPIIDAQGNLSVKVDKRITVALNMPGAILLTSFIGFPDRYISERLWLAVELLFSKWLGLWRR